MGALRDGGATRAECLRRGAQLNTRPSFVPDTPLGIAIGLGVRETYDPSSATALIVQGVLDSISAGILLYAALVELLASDFIYGSHFRKYPVASEKLEKH